MVPAFMMFTTHPQKSGNTDLSQYTGSGYTTPGLFRYIPDWHVGVLPSCRSLDEPNAAFGATLLFITQPLFWGHAFINPKDIPLFSLFLLSVYLGMRMHDSGFLDLRPIPFSNLPLPPGEAFRNAHAVY